MQILQTLIKKTSGGSLIDEFDNLFNQCISAFKDTNAWKLGREIAYGALTCMGRHTITGMLTASGKQFIDWTSAYRLFSKQRIDIKKMFEVIQSNILIENQKETSIVAHMDDTILKKTGRCIPGTAWRRDPLGPHFQTNFIWGQRFLQISMAIPETNQSGQSRSLPIDFHHCPTVKKLPKTADQEQKNKYKELKKQSKLSKQGCERIAQVRKNLNESSSADKELLLSVDGSYTYAEVLKHLPNKMTLIGRIRKDTKLYEMSQAQIILGVRGFMGKESLPQKK